MAIYCDNDLSKFSATQQAEYYDANHTYVNTVCTYRTGERTLRGVQVLAPVSNHNRDCDPDLYAKKDVVVFHWNGRQIYSQPMGGEYVKLCPLGDLQLEPGKDNRLEMTMGIPGTRYWTQPGGYDPGRVCIWRAE
jgi:hypothetical protein